MFKSWTFAETSLILSVQANSFRHSLSCEVSQQIWLRYVDLEKKIAEVMGDVNKLKRKFKKQSGTEEVPAEMMYRYSAPLLLLHKTCIHDSGRRALFPTSDFLAYALVILNASKHNAVVLFPQPSA